MEHLINQIHCRDNLELLREIPDNTIDLIITSPPYNALDSERYDGKYKDKMEWSQYYAWLYNVWKQCYRVLKRGGRLCINMIMMTRYNQPTIHIVFNQCMDIGFGFDTEIIWDRNNSSVRPLLIGSKRAPLYKPTVEYINIYYKETPQWQGNVEAKDITKDEIYKWLMGTWRLRSEIYQRTVYGHGAMFPEELPHRLIKLYSGVGDIVMDIFNGCGTTTLVACKLKRRYIGCDIVEDYCNTARRRIEEYKKQSRIFENI